MLSKKSCSVRISVHQIARVTDRNICQHMAMQMHRNSFGFDSFALDALLSKRTNCFCFLGFSNNRPMLGTKNFRYQILAFISHTYINIDLSFLHQGFIIQLYDIKTPREQKIEKKKLSTWSCCYTNRSLQISIIKWKALKIP